MRFHFHIIDGVNLNDYRGEAFASEADALVHAEEMTKYVARAKRSDKHPKFIKVTNDGGTEVFRLPVPFAP